MTSDIPRSTAKPGNSEAAFAAMASAVARQAPIFVGMCDAQLRPAFLNVAGREMVGLSYTADISAYALLDFLEPQHRPEVAEIGLPAMLRAGRWERELCLCHFTDRAQQREVRWSIFALRNKTGGLIGAAMFANDISVRKQTELALRNQQLLLASVMSNLPLGVGVYNRHGELIHSNQRMRDYTGSAKLPVNEPDALRHWRCYDADSRPISTDRHPGVRALRGETVTPGVDFLYDEPGAAKRWMRMSAVPFGAESGKADGSIVTLQDVDDLKRAAERIELAAAELARQSRFLDTTLSSIPDFVYAFNPQRRFVYANRAMLALFGLSADDMLGRNFADLGYPSDLADRLDARLIGS